MIILIPLPLFFAETIYGVKGLSAWVCIGIIWAFCSAFTVVIYPLYESREALLMVSKGVIKVRRNLSVDHVFNLLKFACLLSRHITSYLYLAGSLVYRTYSIKDRVAMSTPRNRLRRRRRLSNIMMLCNDFYFYKSEHTYSIAIDKLFFHD